MYWDDPVNLSCDSKYEIVVYFQSKYSYLKLSCLKIEQDVDAYLKPKVQHYVVWYNLKIVGDTTSFESAKAIQRLLSY